MCSRLHHPVFEQVGQILKNSSINLKDRSNSIYSIFYINRIQSYLCWIINNLMYRVKKMSSFVNIW